MVRWGPAEVPVLALFLLACDIPLGGDGGGCGANTEAHILDCGCVEGYDWCDDDRLECCAFDAPAYDITVASAVIGPFDVLYDGDPWDWDGDVPSDVADGMDAIAAGYGAVTSADELMDLIAAESPELLDGTNPPDTFFAFYDAQERELYTSATFDDTFLPAFGETFQVAPAAEEDVILYFWEQDPGRDDDVLGFWLPRTDLGWLAGRGETELVYQTNLYALTVSVEARF